MPQSYTQAAAWINGDDQPPPQIQQDPGQPRPGRRGWLKTSGPRGLEPPLCRHQVLQTLRRLMPIDAAFFATADPETLLFTGAHAEEPLGVANAPVPRQRVRQQRRQQVRFAATSATHVASLDDATPGDRSASGRYRDIMRPLSLGDEFRAALMTRPDCPLPAGVGPGSWLARWRQPGACRLHRCSGSIADPSRRRRVAGSVPPDDPIINGRLL